MRGMMIAGVALALAPLPVVAQTVSNAAAVVNATPYTRTFPGTESYRFESDGWSGTNRTIATQATAIATGAAGGTVTATIASEASWATSGLAGSVKLFSLVDFNAPDDRGLNTGSDLFTPQWAYNFTLDRAATLTLDYAIVAQGNRIGKIALGDYFFSLGGPAFKSALLSEQADPSNPTPAGAGRLRYDLLANTAYSMNLYNFGNFWSGLGDGTTKAQADAKFSFQIAAVPEPATWAMMIGGVGFVGGALRRRRAPALRTA